MKTTNIKKGEKLIKLAREIEKMDLQTAIQTAIQNIDDTKIQYDLQRKRTTQDVVWTVTQVGMALMGMKVL